ncbi:hypothetical protein SKAU_G00004370 [Synaphobranchus kaupii]|uniref:Uncharacterized protein n=1 Tax=Synaphobranchus kaupii TaxID=118154 RepID=A0A9Q1G9Z9_SYNKA|nr:hypothetical protein SKAU_G00004370 [Synaphobranchus kaupii]
MSSSGQPWRPLVPDLESGDKEGIETVVSSVDAACRDTAEHIFGQRSDWAGFRTAKGAVHLCAVAVAAPGSSPRRRGANQSDKVSMFGGGRSQPLSIRKINEAALAVKSQRDAWARRRELVPQRFFSERRQHREFGIAGSRNGEPWSG